MNVRLVETRDAGAIADIYRPFVESTTISFELDPPDEQEMRARIVKTLPAHPWLVAEGDDDVLGYAYASAHRTRLAYQWSVDVSAYVRQNAHRRGVGRRLYLSLIRILTLQGFYNAYAGITLPNEASVALHESFGFRRFAVYREVGYKLEAWHDVGWWSLVLQPHRLDPSPPLTLNDLDVDAALAS